MAEKAANQTVVLKVSATLNDKLIKFYEEDFLQKVPPYAIFQAKCQDCVVTLYQSGKLMFQGKRAEEESAIWVHYEGATKAGAVAGSAQKVPGTKSAQKVPGTENTKPAGEFCDDTAIGSDEVGTGDFFGPVVVTASYVKKEDFPKLLALGVRDSKKLTDEKIKQIGQALSDMVLHETYVLSNPAYNEMRGRGINMNQIKAILHNDCLAKCVQKAGYAVSDKNRPQVVVDQFEPPKAYYNHLAGQDIQVEDITFMTKAEDKCLAVAASSIISRYVFLQEMQKLKDEYQLFDAIPLGAGAGVDGYGAALVEEHGWDILNALAKMNFENVNKIKQLL